MSYDQFIRKEIVEDNGYSIFAIPVVGWLTAIAAFGFYYPIRYLVQNKTIIICSKCAHYKPNKLCNYKKVKK